VIGGQLPDIVCQLPLEKVDGLFSADPDEPEVGEVEQAAWREAAGLLPHVPGFEKGLPLLIHLRAFPWVSP